MERSPFRKAVAQLIIKFPAFYGTLRVITSFTRASGTSSESEVYNDSLR
jgi:hypothetical protein